ncbi:MAG: RluA family pseudouridine synthase [Firmicutes bacterium]|nr:RluA family pseudouridine synthase [Bacillota bacterium]
MDEVIRVRAEAADEGARLDKFLAEAAPELSRSRIQKLLDEGRITSAAVLAGASGKNRTELKARDKVHAGDLYVISLPEPQALEVQAEDIPLDIVYEDEDLVVLNKPKGMVVHPAPGNESGTLVNALLYHFGDSLSGINGVQRPGIVHRIDKDTAGLLVVCKTDRAHRGMAEMLAVHDIERAYHAIVYGNFQQDEGTVDAPIGRDPRDRKRMAICEDGRRAVTHYRVIERFGNFTYIEARLETGRTHQIRVHMRSIGHPLLGDPVYGPKELPRIPGIKAADLDGQMLVAKVLGFVHPITGEEMRFETDLPDSFQRVLDALRKGR